MNVFTAIMLIFAAIGFFDVIIGDRLGLAKSFNKGLATIGSMAVPTLSVCCVGVELIERNIKLIEKITAASPIDPSLLGGLFLAPDTGGFFISRQLTGDYDMLVLNGVVIGALFGQMVSYQIPIFLSTLDREHHMEILKGFVVGVAVIPVGLLAAELLLGMNIKQYLWQVVPILILCILITIGLLKFFDKTLKFFSAFAAFIQLVVNLMFLITIIGIFIPDIAYVDVEIVTETLVIIIKAAIVISGSLVFSELILKNFEKNIQRIADRLAVNEVAVIGMLMNCATSLAVLPLIQDMDKKGKMLNAAFSVSGAYVLGGQLGFVSSVIDGRAVMIMVIVKFMCGILSMFIMHKIYKLMA